MNRFFFIALVLITVTSCTVYQEYPIEVYKPGKINFPEDVNDIALIYRNFKYPGDSLQNYYKDDFKLKKANNDPANLDSIMATACLNELAKNLKTNNSANNIQVIPYNVFKRHTSKTLPPLDFETVKRIANATNTNLIISLETLSYFYATYPEAYESMGYDEVITVAVWGVYNPVMEKLIERKTMIDTIVWHPYNDQGNYDRNYKAPPRLTALRIATSMAGENYSRRFYASWETVDRMYSIPPLPDFSDAAFYFEEGKWNTAIGLWKKYADDRNGKMAINARYNIALAYEIKDEIDLAIQWITAARDLAVKLKSREDLKRILNYQSILENRKKEIIQLNQS